MSRTSSSPLAVPGRLLLGSGPSPVPERVLQALALPTIGHLDPAFGELMDATAELLRSAFETANPATLPLSATGSGGMEAMVANLIEPGDRVVCGVNGAFGGRMADALWRAGADVVRVEAEWGRAVPFERLIEAVTAAGSDLAALFVVHGETSTGVCQPLDGLGEACRERDALLLIDCVTSLGGQRVALDDHGVDAAFSGTQKCLNCPPGLAPFSAGERAIAKLRERSTQVRSWYFDLEGVLGYWLAGGGGGAGAGGGAGGGGAARAYHHTAPINLIYALHEALAIVAEEGLARRWARHERGHEALRTALAQLDLERLAPAGEELHPLLAVRVPEAIDEAAVRRSLLRDHGIEISGGLGPLAGQIWRIGVMGVGAAFEPQARLVTAIAQLLDRNPDDALAALEAGWKA